MPDQFGLRLDGASGLAGDIVSNRYRPLGEPLDVPRRRASLQADVDAGARKTPRDCRREMMNRLRSNSDGPNVKLAAEMTTNARPTAGAVARVSAPAPANCSAEQRKNEVVEERTGRGPCT